nr:methyltransferase domain-containing protein [Candidatus Njordarchaeota archaeon]
MPVNSSNSSAVKREIRSTFDFISSDYDKLRSRIWEDLIEFTTESLSPFKLSRDDLILDLACGNARHAIYFAEKYRLRGIAIDFSTQLLKLADKRIEAFKQEHMIALINSDASRIPLRRHSVDAALYIAAIHHLPTTTERLESLREISRTLIKRGRAVVTVWRRWQKRFTLHFLKERLKRSVGCGSKGEFGDIYIPWGTDHGASLVLRFYHLFSKRESKKLVSKAGFRLIRISKSSKKAGEAGFFICIEKK